jgi:hypothetical protein
MCFLILLFFLFAYRRHCWYGYGPYFGYGYGPYSYPYGSYSHYDPYWRARYYGYPHYRGY